MYQAHSGVSRRKQGRQHPCSPGSHGIQFPKHGCVHYIYLDPLWHILFTLFYNEEVICSRSQNYELEKPGSKQNL